jgi:hypothetical protein
LKRVSVLRYMFLEPLPKIRCSYCVDSYPGVLFCSTGLHVCFGVSTMLFLLLLLCNIV